MKTNASPWDQDMYISVVARENRAQAPTEHYRVNQEALRRPDLAPVVPTIKVTPTMKNHHAPRKGETEDDAAVTKAGEAPTTAHPAG